MKRLMFMMLAVFASGFLTAQAAPSAYAVLQDGVLTFRYDENKPTEGNVWDFPVNAAAKTDAPWKDEAANITSVVIEPSMKDYEIATYGLEGLFSGCVNLVSIDGLNNLNVTKALRMNSMFNNCALLTEIDISRWQNAKEANFVAHSAFLHCTALLKIYVSDKFKPVYATSNNSPFNYSEKSKASKDLTGGNGTKWSTSAMGYARAVIDRPGQPGYFTGRAWIDVDLQGGVGVYATSYDLEGEAITDGQSVELGVPSMDGYDFTGWTLPAEQLADGVTVDSETGVVTLPADYLKSFTAVATWKPQSAASYTISYYLGDTHYDGHDEVYDYSETEPHVLQFTDPTVSPGMRFTGWFRDKACTDGPITEIAAGEIGDKVLYAGEIVTHEGTYNISYYCDKVKYDDVHETYDYSETESHVLELTNPKMPAGKKFVAWFADEDCTQGPVTEIPAGTWGDQSFYAGTEIVGDKTLIWNGSADDDWLNAQNWTPNEVPTEVDVIKFDGTAADKPIRFYGSKTVLAIILAGDVTINAPTDFTLRLLLSGFGNITKIGSGALTVSAANTYVGTTIVKEGTLVRSGAQAFGPAGNALVVTNATLKLGGYNSSNVGYDLTLEEGAVLDASGQLQGYSGLASVTLTGNAEIFVGNIYPTPTTLCGGSLSLNGHTFKKTGVGKISVNAGSWQDVDSGTLHVGEGRFESSWSSSYAYGPTNMLLWVGSGAEYYEGQNSGMNWKCIRATNNSRFLSLLSNSNWFKVNARDRIVGGLTAQALSLSNGCVYEPLVVGDCVTVSNELLLVGNIILDVSHLTNAEPKKELPLLISPTEVPVAKVSEVRTAKGKPWPVYSRQRTDGMWELGVLPRTGGVLLFVR